MFTYKKFNASDINKSPAEAHKQWNITSDNTSSLGIDFFSARFSSSSKFLFGINDLNESKKYFQLDHLYYDNNHINYPISELKYEDQERRLYDKLNIISIPQGLFGSSIYNNSVNLQNGYRDDGLGNIYLSTTNINNYPTDKDRVLYLGPVKGFKSTRLDWDYKNGRKLVNPSTILNKKDLDDSYYSNPVEYISSSIVNLSELNCTGVNLTHGYVKYPHKNDYNFGETDNYTISFYYKSPSSLAGTKYLVAKSYSQTVVNSPETGISGLALNTNTSGSLQAVEVDAGSSTPFEIFLEGSSLNFSIADDSSFKTITKSSALTTNTLNHFTFVKSGSELQIWKDGVKIESGSHTIENTKTPANLYIGVQGGTRSRYSSAGGTLSQLMIFNTALNSTQITNVSESITGLPYIGNVFYENGLITITSPKHNSSLLAVNDSTSSIVTIGPTFGNINNFTDFAISESAPVVFKATISAFTSSFIHKDSKLTRFDFFVKDNINEGGANFILEQDSTFSGVGNTIKYSLTFDSASSENYLVQAFTSKNLVHGAFHNPSFINFASTGISDFDTHPDAVGGFIPSGSCSITTNNTKFLLSSSGEQIIDTQFLLQASASQLIASSSFPTSDTSLSDTPFTFNDNTSTEGTVYLESFAINGLAMSGSLSDIPNYVGSINRITTLNGGSADGFTDIRVTYEQVSPSNSAVEFVDNGFYNTISSGGRIGILDTASGVPTSASFKMTAKFTNSNPTKVFNGQMRIVSESGASAQTLGTVKFFSIPPNTTTPITHQLDLANRPLKEGENYRMQVNMNGSSQLNMTEATLQIFSQTPTAGKRNKISLTHSPSATILPYFGGSGQTQADKSRRYLIKFGEIHTSASNQSSGPNHLSLSTGSLKIELVSNVQGTSTVLTSSLIPSGTLSSSFAYLFHPGDLSNSGTEGTAGNMLSTISALFTRLKVVDPNNPDTLLSFSQGEGFTIKDFSIREISGSTSIISNTNINSKTGNSINFNNNLPTSASTPISSVTLDSGTNPNYIVSKPILTIDATGSLIFESASVVGSPAGFVSASFTSSIVEAGAYILHGFDVDTNYDSGKNIRVRIYSGSQLITSSKNQTNLNFGSSIDLGSANGTSFANSDHTGSAGQVQLGAFGPGGVVKVLLDAVDDSSNPISISPSFSASFSNLGIIYLTSSNLVKQVKFTNISAGPFAFEDNQTYNQLRVDSTAVNPPFSNGAITSSFVQLAGSNLGSLGEDLFFTSSQPATLHVDVTPAPIVIERDLNLQANRVYEITQSLLFTTSSEDTDNVYVRMFRKGTQQTFGSFGTFNVPSPVVGGDFPGPKVNTQTFTGNGNALEEFKGKVTINPGQEGIYTIQLYYGTGSTSNYPFNNTPDEVSNVVIHLASASLKEIGPSSTVTKIAGNNFTSANVSNLRIKTTEGGIFTARNLNILSGTGSNQVHVSTSFANENGTLLPPLAGFNEFTVNSNSEIELHNGEIFIINGEITGSGNATFFYFTPTSSLNVTSGFNNSMQGGNFTDSSQGDFLILTASSDTFNINENYFSTTDQTFLVNYINPSTVNDFSLLFKNTHLIFENEYMCTVDENEYNFTLNPTARKLKSINNGELANFATGSNFKPYVTTIGLYSDDGELLVVGKLGQPIKMSDETDTTFIVRYDT